MTVSQERLELEREYEELQSQLGAVVAKLIELDTDRAARESGLMAEVQNAMEQIRATLTQVAVLLDAMSAAPAVHEAEEVEAPSPEGLNEDVLGILAQLFSPEEIEQISQLKGDQRRVFIEQLQKLWAKYSGPRGKFSSIQTNRFGDMYVRGLTIREVAVMEQHSPSLVATGVQGLVKVLSRGHAEERSAAIARAQMADSEPKDLPKPIAAPSVLTLVQAATDSTPLDNPAVPKVAFRPPIRVASPAVPEQPTKESVAAAPKQERPVVHAPTTAREWKEWVVRKTPDIVTALQGRYARGNAVKYHAAETLLSSANNAFTPMQREIIGDILQEIGLDVKAPFAELTRAILDLSGKLHGFGMTDEQIKYFGTFVGLRVVPRQDTVEITGVTNARTISQMLRAGRDGGNIELLTIQVKVSQALILFLKATKPPQ